MICITHLDEFSRLLWDTVVWPCLEVKVKDSSWLSSGNQTAFPPIALPTGRVGCITVGVAILRLCNGENTVKHRNNGKIRRRQTLRYLDASYYFVLLISIIYIIIANGSSNLRKECLLHLRYFCHGYMVFGRSIASTFM